MNSPTATKDKQHNDKNLGQKDKQISVTHLSHTRLQFSFLIVVVKVNFVYISNIFLISRLRNSARNLGKRLIEMEKIYYVDQNIVFHFAKLTNSDAALPSN